MKLISIVIFYWNIELKRATKTIYCTQIKVAYLLDFPRINFFWSEGGDLIIAFYLVVASEIGCLSNDDHDDSAFFKTLTLLFGTAQLVKCRRLFLKLNS